MNCGHALERDIVPDDSVSQFQPNDQQQYRQYATTPAHAHAHATFSPPGPGPSSLGIPSPCGTSSFHAGQCNPSYSGYEAPHPFSPLFRPGVAAGGSTMSVGSTSTRSAPNAASARHQLQRGIQAPRGSRTTVSGIVHPPNGYAGILAGGAEYTAHQALGNGVSIQGGSVLSYDQVQRSKRNETIVSAHGDWQSVAPPRPMNLDMNNTAATGMMTPHGGLTPRGLPATVESTIDSQVTPCRGGASHNPSSHHQSFQPRGRQQDQQQSLATPPSCSSSSSSHLAPPHHYQEQSSLSNSRTPQVQNIASPLSASTNSFSSVPMPESSSSSSSSSHGDHDHQQLPRNIRDLLDTLKNLLTGLAAEANAISGVLARGAQAIPLLEERRKCATGLSQQIRINVEQLEVQLGLAAGLLRVEDTLVALLGEFYEAPSTGTESG